jgi:hypothetical protein
MAKWTKVTRDKSHLKIQHELEDRGFSVVDLAMVGEDVCDLLVASPTTSCLAEIKEGLDSQITTAQIRFIANWKGNAMIALTVEDITHAMRNQVFLTQVEKDKMLQIAIRQEYKSIDTNPRITVKRLRKLMNESN